MRRWLQLGKLMTLYLWFAVKWLPLVYITGIYVHELDEMETEFLRLERLADTI